MDMQMDLVHNFFSNLKFVQAVENIHSGFVNNFFDLKLYNI